MREAMFSRFSDLLDPKGPVAIIIKQSLAPVNEDDRTIFPPSYPITTFRGRVHTILDGDYRVSVELPADPKRKKDDKSPDQTSGYNIDRFPDGTNSCEIDSPQSQANRIEPMFKDTPYRDLVPQIEIKVGNDPVYGIKVNLLDAGHRAGDAVVRMSSLTNEFHNAFLDAKAGNHFTLATVAPTSLLFGVWDSRSTQVKVQRIIKASIFANNVRERTRSAQFTPAADYVAAGAVDSARDSGEGDNNPLSSEGMKHALAVQKAGGVMLSETSELTRTVNLNLVALRALKGNDDSKTQALQRYILGLALVAATSNPDLNLREGCNLRFKNSADSHRLIPQRGETKSVGFDPMEIVAFAEASAKAFFQTAGIDFDKKDHLDEVFETGVADEFLGFEKGERDRIRQMGPITAGTLTQFREQGNDPFKLIKELLKAAKAALGRAPKKGSPVQNLIALTPLYETFRQMSENPSLPDDAKNLASELAELAREHVDSHLAVKDIEAKLKAFKKAQGDGAKTDAPVA